LHIDIHSAARIRDERTYFVIVAFLTLVGGLLRRYHLGQQSLWFDEADLVMRARQPLPALLRNVINPGENGPLYTLGMAAWIKMLGTSEVTVRLPSAIAGTLAIPALYGLGRTLRGPRLALIAAALLTISPYAHWYAQDAKMYSLLVLLTIVATWVFLAAIRRGGAAWVVYGIVAALALGIHATFLLVLAAHAVIAVGLWRAGYGVRPARRQARWLALLIGVAALPLLIWGAIFAVQNGPTWQVKATPWAILQRMLVEFSVTHRAGDAAQTWGVWLFVALAALGIGLTWQVGKEERSISSSRLTLLVVGAMTAVPGLLFMLLSVQRAVFEDRYLIVTLPGFLLLAALGLDRLLRWKPTCLLAVAAGVAVLIVAWIPLRDVNFSTVPQKEDWRAAYRHIAEHQRPGDALVIAPGYLRSTYDYYALRFPTLGMLPVIAPTANLTDREVTALLQTETRGRERVWLLRSDVRAPLDDPHGQLLAFFNREATDFDAERLNGVLLNCEVYDGPYEIPRPPLQRPLDLRFGDTGIGLVGASLETADRLPHVARGAFAPLLLRWTMPDSPIAADYTVLVRLTDTSGHEVGRYDIPPLDGHWPTSQWRFKDDLYDPHDLKIPADLAPGHYGIRIGLAPTHDPLYPAAIIDASGTRVDMDGLVQALTIDVV